MSINSLTDLDRVSEILSIDEIFGVIPDLVFVLNAENVILEYRAGNESDLYLPPNQFLGQRMCQVLPEEPAAIINEAINIVKATKESNVVEYRLIVQ